MMEQREQSNACINSAESRKNKSEAQMRHSGIEWIGEIPKEWKVARLKNLIQCLDSKRIPMEASQRKKGTYPYWGAGSIMDYVDDFIFDEELVLLGEDGAPFFDRKRNVAFYVNEKVWINNHIHVLRPLNGINAHFLTHFLNIVDYKSYINGSILNKLTQSNMNEICCLVLPENEQQKIANYLDKVCGEVDEMIALQEQMIEELKAYKQSVITEAVTKGLNPNVPMKNSGIDWIGEIPEGWKVKRLKEIFLLQTGTTPKDYANGLDTDNLINWFTPSDVSEMNCELNGSQRHLSKNVADGEGIKLYPKGSLIFVAIGASAGKIGYINIEGYSNQQITALIPQNNCYSKYFYYYMLADRKRIRDNAFFTTLPIINNGYLSSVKILLPPLSEQQSIASYLDTKCAEIDALIAIKQAKIEELKDYKKSVIYEYVTGKKEVV